MGSLLGTQKGNPAGATITTIMTFIQANHRHDDKSGIHGGGMTGGAREFEAMPTPVHTGITSYIILIFCDIKDAAPDEDNYEKQPADTG